MRIGSACRKLDGKAPKTFVLKSKSVLSGAKNQDSATGLLTPFHYLYSAVNIGSTSSSLLRHFTSKEISTGSLNVYSVHQYPSLELIISPGGVMI
jgi:hypothetical protein